MSRGDDAPSDLLDDSGGHVKDLEAAPFVLQSRVGRSGRIMINRLSPMLIKFNKRKDCERQAGNR